jgi:hypothetical protein
MKINRNAPRNKFALAFEAIDNLLLQDLRKIFSRGWMAAMSAHAEIGVAPVRQKTHPFYRHLAPFRTSLVSALTGSYRQYFRLALAHRHQTGHDPHEWAWGQLQCTAAITVEQIRDWYILACDGENPSPQSWRAPAWLFHVSLAHFGIGLLKPKHVPANDAEEKLNAAHTRLLLKGARRVFLLELRAAIERVRNEEVATAGAIPEEPGNKQVRRPINRKGWEQREKLHKTIRKILHNNPELEGMDFCAALDKHHPKPLYDWTKRGEWQSHFTWKIAWKDPGLREKIRRVRQEAMRKR